MKTVTNLSVISRKTRFFNIAAVRRSSGMYTEISWLLGDCFLRSVSVKDKVHPFLLNKCVLLNSFGQHRLDRKFSASL
jgi:hypothetical protein